MGLFRNLSCVDTRRAQEIEFSDLKESVYGESQLQRIGRFDQADHLE